MAERRTGALTIAAAAFALVFARAQSDAAPPPGEAFAIVTNSPNLELRFRGVSLRGARTDEQQNQIALDFNGPVDGGLFDKLQATLPDWVDMAYAGYDNAVIRAKRPVQFLTRGESDGFSLRLVPAATQVAQAAPPPPPAPPPPDMGGAQRADNPFGLRGSEDSPPGTMLRLSTDWRHAHHGNVYALRAGADIPLGGGFKITGSGRAALANNPAVRRLDGTISPFRDSAYSGALGLGYDFNSASEIHAQALYSAAGLGGLLGASEHSRTTKLGLIVAYRAPFNFSSEEIADRGSYDYARAYGTFQLFDGLWVRGEGRYDRYAVRGDGNLASTAGFTAGLRYMPNWFGFPLGIGYDGDGDYIIKEHTYLDPSLNPFVPMNIRTREVHAVSGLTHISFSDGFSLDAFGGYAMDRYGTNGGFAGADIVVIPSDGWRLSLNGYYSTVPYRQGQGSGPAMGASIRLIYDLSNSPFDPFLLGFLRDEI